VLLTKIMKGMKRIIFIALTIILIIGCGQNKRKSDEIKIGVLIPLTGESAFWGNNIKDGIDLATEKINNGGGILGKKITLYYEDSKGESRTAVNAVNKLIKVNRVGFIIGDVISSNILAIAPIVNRHRIPLIGFGESSEITYAGDYIFRNWNSASTDAKITGKFASKNSSKIVMLSRNDAFGISAAQLFENEINNSCEILLHLEFDVNNKNFNTIITRFKGMDYDGIYFAGFHKEALDFLKQYIQQGGKIVNIYGVSSWEEESLLNFIIGNYKGNVFYGYPKPPDSNLLSVRKFNEAFLNKYNRKPQILNDNGFDAVYMFKYAIENASTTNGEMVREQLINIREFNGAMGIFSMDENGDVDKPFGLKKINSFGINWIEL
jgi:branched-chain amino acid transport system substrate-binding protein